MATIAIIAIVVFTALNCGGYKSMLPEDLFGGSGVENTMVEDAANAES